MPDERETNDLAELIRDLSGGEFHEGATKEMKELVASMMEVERNTGGKPKGKLTVTLDVVLDGGILDIRGSVSVKKPSKVNGRVMRYGTQDGVLLREDPRQGLLALGRGQVRDAVPDFRDKKDRD